MSASDKVFAVLAALLIAAAVYSGIKGGVQSVVHPPPLPVKEPKVREPRPEPPAPEGKMWARIGKDRFLVPVELTKPRPKPSKRKRRPKEV